MMQSLRLLLRQAGLGVAHTLGARIVDSETGESLGRALVIPWGGRIHIIGLNKPVRAKFLPQARVTYWKQELGFTLHSPPDFPSQSKPEIRG